MCKYILPVRFEAKLGGRRINIHFFVIKYNLILRKLFNLTAIFAEENEMRALSLPVLNHAGRLAFFSYSLPPAKI